MISAVAEAGENFAVCDHCHDETYFYEKLLRYLRRVLRQWDIWWWGRRTCRADL